VVPHLRPRDERKHTDLTTAAKIVFARYAERVLIDNELST
jgi:hypothetical protein